MTTPQAIERRLTVSDTVFVIVGIVVGAGIFKSPSLVAANAASDATMLLMWLAGGVIALIGALCYAELASAFPSTGGDYHFLQRAFGRGTGFLFAWARLAIMQTGSIALLAFVFGDYVSTVAPLGPHAPAIYAAAAVIVFSLINYAGIREGKGTQALFTSIEIAGLLAIAIACLVFVAPAATDLNALNNSAAAAGAAIGPATDAAVTPVTPAPASSAAAIGLAMVFVLLTFGGWNEAAFVSAEVRGAQSPIARALLVSLTIITGLYLLANMGYLRALGRTGMAQSETVAADAVRLAFGEPGVAIVAVLVAVSALTSINATIITGARCNHALGRDFAAFRALGRWDQVAGTPRTAILVQGVIALLLVGLGALTRAGFSTLVEYTAPVFWLFFLLTGVAVFRLRSKEPGAPRPFRVPLYPLTPLIFCATSLYMLWSSVSYTGVGAWVGVAVLLVGLPVYVVARRVVTSPEATRVQT